MKFLVLICGSMTGLGLLVVRLGVLGRRLVVMAPSSKNIASFRSVGFGMTVLVLLLLLTGWVFAAVASGVATFAVCVSTANRAGTRANEEVAEAISLWTEQLRDTLAAAHGLQQTLLATATHAPNRIASQVQRLAAKLPYAPVGQSLREFASEVDHSSADFVAAALIAATEHEARDVGALLDHLARCSREEARMHQRIWVGRSRTRAAVRIISFTIIGFPAILFVMNRDYLDPYGTPVGQLVLVGIISVFTISLLLLQSGSRVQVPERFVAVAS